MSLFTKCMLDNKKIIHCSVMNIQPYIGTLSLNPLPYLLFSQKMVTKNTRVNKAATNCFFKYYKGVSYILMINTKQRQC